MRLSSLLVFSLAVLAGSVLTAEGFRHKLRPNENVPTVFVETKAKGKSLCALRCRGYAWLGARIWECALYVIMCTFTMYLVLSLWCVEGEDAHKHVCGL